jgi:hypothetical protein
MMMFAAGGLAYFVERSLRPRFPGATKIACAFAMIAFAAIMFCNAVVAPSVVISETSSVLF